MALAVAEFREDDLLEEPPATMTEFTVSVLKQPVEHKIRLRQVEKWASSGGVSSPALMIKKQKVWKLLGNS